MILKLVKLLIFFDPEGKGIVLIRYTISSLSHKFPFFLLYYKGIGYAKHYRC